MREIIDEEVPNAKYIHLCTLLVFLAPPLAPPPDTTVPFLRCPPLKEGFLPTVPSHRSEPAITSGFISRGAVADRGEIRGGVVTDRVGVSSGAVLIKLGRDLLPVFVVCFFAAKFPPILLPATLISMPFQPVAGSRSHDLVATPPASLALVSGAIVRSGPTEEGFPLAAEWGACLFPWGGVG